MATLTNRTSQLSAPVTISYKTLFEDPMSLEASIGMQLIIEIWTKLKLLVEEGFGSSPSSLGIIIVRDLPAAYSSMRERMLKYAYRFANLDEKVKDKYVDPTSIYR
jgi:hypothetical protein